MNLFHIIAASSGGNSAQTVDPYVYDVTTAVAVNASNHLDIPTSVTAETPLNQNTHPSVLYFPSGWNGYNWWMAMTPYPGWINIYENPEIVASNDGVTWVVPNGLTNPITPLDPAEQAAGRYHSDTELLFDNNTLYCYYRGQTVGGEYYVDAKSSTDGVNWSAATRIFQNFSSTGVYLSPSILKIDDDFIMWTADSDTGTGYGRIRRYQATSPLSTWTNIQECVIRNMPADRFVWHLKVTKPGDQYHMTLCTSVAYGGSMPTNLYFATSDDGITWTVANDPLLLPITGWQSTGIYRACQVFRTDNGTPYYDLYYSAVSGSEWFTGLTRIDFTGMAQKMNMARGTLDSVTIT